MPYSVFPRFGRIGLDYESRIRPVIKSSSLSLSLRKRPSRLLCHKGHCSRCEEVNQRANQTKEHSQSRLRCLWSFAGSPPGAPDSSLSSSFLSPPNNMPVGGSAYSKRVLAYVRYLAMDRCPIEVLFSHHAQYSRDTGFVNFCHSLSEEALVIVVFMCVNVLVVLQMYHLFPTWTFSVLKSLPPPPPENVPIEISDLFMEHLIPQCLTELSPDSAVGCVFLPGWMLECWMAEFLLFPLGHAVCSDGWPTVTWAVFEMPREAVKPSFMIDKFVLFPSRT